MKFIDIHSHLADHYFDEDRDEVIARMHASDVETITIGVDEKTSQDAIECAAKYDNVWACIGVHPEDGDSFDELVFNELVQHDNVVAIGECGLDYFRTDDKIAARKKQLPFFEQQIHFALEHDLPLMLHIRPSKGSVDAYDEVLEVLLRSGRAAGRPPRGNAHFFAGNVDQAKRFFDLGFTISFTGVITFTNDYDDVIQMAPLDMLHAETDAPFVTPKPHRGKRCEPMHVVHVVEKIAQLKKLSIEDTAEQLLANAARLFNI